MGTESEARKRFRGSNFRRGDRQRSLSRGTGPQWIMVSCYDCGRLASRDSSSRRVGSGINEEKGHD